MPNTLSNIVSISNISSMAFSAGFVYDTNAQTYFTATGITDTIIKNAINTLVLAAKANGWWTLHPCIYPVPDATQAHCQVNLKNPGTFDLTFVNGWTFAATGMTPNGTSAYADTGYVPSTQSQSALSKSLSFYNRTNSLANTVEIGTYSGSLLYSIYCKDTGGLAYSSIDNDAGAAVTDARGLVTATRNSATSNIVYKNGSNLASQTGTVTGVAQSVSVYIGALNNINFSGAGTQFSARECAFAAIGSSISATIAASMYTDIQAYQTSMGRNV